MAFGSLVGVEHHLLVYGSDPGWTYSDIRGFEPFIGPWLWFKLYWAAWALLLAVAATLFWVRGKEADVGSRLAVGAPPPHAPNRRRVAAAAAALVLTSGGFIFYNTNVLNAYRTASDGVARRAEYERRYGQYEGHSAAAAHGHQPRRRDLPRATGGRDSRHVQSREHERRGDRAPCISRPAPRSRRRRCASTGRRRTCSPTRSLATASTPWRRRCGRANRCGSSSRCASSRAGSRTPGSMRPSSRTARISEPARGCRRSAIRRTASSQVPAERRAHGLAAASRDAAPRRREGASR